MLFRSANTHPRDVGCMAYQEDTRGNHGQTALVRVEAGEEVGRPLSAARGITRALAVQGGAGSSTKAEAGVPLTWGCQVYRHKAGRNQRAAASRGTSRRLTWQGNEGTFWNDADVVCAAGGLGCTRVCICHLRILCFIGKFDFKRKRL